MLQRFRQAVTAGQTAMEAAKVIETADRRLITPVTALMVLDDVDAAGDRLKSAHLSRAEASGARALFILSPLSAPDFMEYALLTEFLPVPEDLVRTTGDTLEVAKRYRLRRLEIMLRKWNIRDCHTFGPEANRLAASASAHGVVDPASTAFHSTSL